MTDSIIVKIVAELLRHTPEWIRTDLATKDSAARSRAEETLAAMIAAALARTVTNA